MWISYAIVIWNSSRRPVQTAGEAEIKKKMLIELVYTANRIQNISQWFNWFQQTQYFRLCINLFSDTRRRDDYDEIWRVFGHQFTRQQFHSLISYLLLSSLRIYAYTNYILGSFCVCLKHSNKSKIIYLFTNLRKITYSWNQLLKWYIQARDTSFETDFKSEKINLQVVMS